MYAVIKTGGKQYRVQPGDVLVVEKLEGDVGSEIAFDQVLMLGDGGEVILGAPLVDGAVVRATLMETRKGEKVKILKKIRRQGYRRTRGHRQIETVLQVTGMEGAGKSLTWDGTVDFTPLAIRNARARGLKHEAALLEAALTPVVMAAPEPTPAKAKAAAKKAVQADVVDEQAAAAPEEATPVAAAETAETPKKKAAPKKAKPASDTAE